MAEAATKKPVKVTEKAPAQTPPSVWRPFESLHREIDRLFDDFNRGFWPLQATRATGWALAPAVDVVEKDKAYEVTAELPGLDEKNIEVELANGMLTIKGEKREEKEEKKKDYYLSERRFGSFQRAFRVPDGVDTGKIDASFQKGVLTVRLPKTAEAQKSTKKIAVKAG